MAEFVANVARNAERSEPLVAEAARLLLENRGADHDAMFAAVAERWPALTVDDLRRAIRAAVGMAEEAERVRTLEEHPTTGSPN